MSPEMGMINLSNVIRNRFNAITITRVFDRPGMKGKDNDRKNRQI